MSRIPRLLPLAAVAIGGVLAINLMAGARDFPSLLQGARAWAEDLAPKAKSRAAPKGTEVAAATAPLVVGQSPLPPPLIAGQPGAAPGAPGVCTPTAADLAAKAELSEGELQLLLGLRSRASQLDAREQGFDTQMAALVAAEAKIDGKLASMADLIKQMQALVGQAEAQEKAESDRLVKTYEGMTPKKAAQQLAIMSDEVRLPIMANMNVRKLSAIMAEMKPDEAKVVSERLAGRLSNALALNQARAALAAGAPAAPVAPGRGGTAAPPPAPGRGGAAAAPAGQTKAGPTPPAAPPKTAATPPAAAPKAAPQTPPAPPALPPKTAAAAPTTPGAVPPAGQPKAGAPAQPKSG